MHFYAIHVRNEQNNMKCYIVAYDNNHEFKRIQRIIELLNDAFCLPQPQTFTPIGIFYVPLLFFENYYSSFESSLVMEKRIEIFLVQVNQHLDLGNMDLNLI